MVHFSCLIIVIFSLISMEIFVVFSNARSILELMLCNRNLTKFEYSNFVKFRLQSMSYKIKRAFEKTTKYVFVFILPTPYLPWFFLHFLLNFKKNISYL